MAAEFPGDAGRSQRFRWVLYSGEDRVLSERAVTEGGHEMVRFDKVAIEDHIEDHFGDLVWGELPGRSAVGSGSRAG